MICGSLFSGIGGFDLAFQRTSIETIWQVEIDPKCRQTLARHFPSAERFDDVQTCTERELRSVDVITGGFPCQDLSLAGRRAGLSGKRSGLWFEFHRLLAILKPQWVIVENVPGLLSSNAGRDFAIILRGMVELGYGVCWRILDAQYFGVAQRRRRLFIVASLGSYHCIPVLFEPDCGARNTETVREARSCAPTLLASGAGTDRTASAGSEAEYCIVAPIAATLRSRESSPGVGMPGRGGEDDANLILAPIMRSQKADRGCDDSHLIVPSYWDGSQIADTLDVSAISKGQMMPDKRRFPCVLSHGVRRLTPTECERLQGFPDGWTDLHRDTVRYAQLGNAVAVPVVQWIAERIQKQVQKQVDTKARTR